MEQLIFILILGALALGRYFLENAGSSGGDAPEDTPKPIPRQRPVPPMPRAGSPREETEEERMRRFMEALGLPPTEPAPQRRAEAERRRPEERKPAVPAPKPDPRHLGEPFGGPSLPPVFRRKKAAESRRATAPLQPGRPQPQLQPAAAPLAPIAAPMNETAPAMEVASLPGIDIPDAGSAVASAGAWITPAAPAVAGETGAGGDNLATAILRQQLRDPASLRRAILLREILGTPKGLQSAGAPSIFQLP